MKLRTRKVAASLGTADCALIGVRVVLKRNKGSFDYAAARLRSG
jgi:hypothetical protein